MDQNVTCPNWLKSMSIPWLRVFKRDRQEQERKRDIKEEFESSSPDARLSVAAPATRLLSLQRWWASVWRHRRAVTGGVVTGRAYIEIRVEQSETIQISLTTPIHIR